MHETSGLAEQVVKLTNEALLMTCPNQWILVDGDEDGWFYFCPRHENSVGLDGICQIEVLSPGSVVSLSQHTARHLIALGDAEQMEMHRPDGSSCKTLHGRADEGDWPYHLFAAAAKWPGPEIHREISDWLYGL